MSRGVGWAIVVLGLVFVDELLAIAGYGLWGWQAPTSRPLSWLLVWLLPLAAAVVWSVFASPRARRGGPLARPVAKVLIFGGAVLALWHLDRPGWALALLAFSVVINALAMLPGVRAAVAAADRVSSSATRRPGER